jgi:predicted metal-dependent hydrolase
MPLKTIEDFARSKIKWILKNLAKAAKAVRALDKNEYVSGENITLFGKVYRLNVYDYGRKPAVLLKSDSVDLYADRGSSKDEREEILDGFYAARLSEAVSVFAKDWLEKLNIFVEKSPVKAGIKNFFADLFCTDGGLESSRSIIQDEPRFYFRRMKSRWGSCNISDKKITINTLLAKKSLRCVEYVAVHEMLHLKERRHNKRFKDYMKKAFPDWKKLEEELKFVG